MHTLRKSVKFVLFYIFNSIQTFFPRVSKRDLDIIKNTRLFPGIENEYKIKTFTGVSLIKHPEDTLIFLEGEQGDALYIIKKGSVRVFTYDQHNKKIPLARLNAGAYFGEQAILGQTTKTRNANIEAITDVTLIKINKKFTDRFFYNALVKRHITEKGLTQALKMLSLSADFYNDLESIIPNLDEISILNLSKDKLIFNAGDEPDNVYIILQGQVKLQILNKKTNSYSSLLLHKGQIFGELGVLNGKPRSATAITNSDVRLLLIGKDKFNKYLSKNKNLQNVLAKLRQIYQIPMVGVVEQYINDVKNMGQAITNIYKMDDGRSIISSHFLNQDLFMMHTANHAPKAHYTYAIGNNKIEIGVTDYRIISLIVHGCYENLPAICHCILSNEFVDSTVLTNFESTGRLITHTENDEIICECMSVTRSELQKLIDQDITNLDTLSRETGACTACRGCLPKILQMIGNNYWLSASIKKIESHNNYINSYLITPKDKINLPKPGQYILIQAKVNDNWIERPYTISDVYPSGELCITIKKRKNGLFTQWLFENSQKENDIYVTQPQGIFTLNQSTESLCFAGGIGITPFIMFARALAKSPEPKSIHIHYTVTNSDDLIYKDEFNALSKILSVSLITYRITQTSGSLTKDIIVNEIKSFNSPDIYICGPEGYVLFIKNILQKMNYDPTKIHAEAFVYAGIA